tara:strand:+ start:911 stop:1111 length:201 start_codon:yes stop_codon:yes gene_type:complete
MAKIEKTKEHHIQSGAAFVLGREDITVTTDIFYKVTGRVDKIIAFNKISNDLKAEALRMELAKYEK